MSDFASEFERLLLERVRGIRGGRDAGAERGVRTSPKVGQALERIYDLEQAHPGTGNSWRVHRVGSALDAARLREAANALARRYDVLRLQFRRVEGGLARTVAPFAAIPLDVLDLRGRPVDAVRKAMLAEALRPFDIGAAPLVRVVLGHVDGDGSLLLVVLHDLVADCASLARCVTELAAAYDEIGRGAALGARRAPPTSNRDTTGDGSDSAFWQARLGGSLPAFPIARDRPRPASRQRLGRICGVAIPADAYERLVTIGTRNAATPAMTVLAAVAQALVEISGRRDVVIGVPVAARAFAGGQDAIGRFEHIAPVRFAVAPSEPCASVINRIKRALLEVIPRVGPALDDLMSGASDAGEPPIQVHFNFVRREPTVQVAGFAMDPFDIGAVRARTDLTVYADASGQDLSLEVCFDTDVFDVPVAERLLRTVHENLMSFVAEQPAATQPRASAQVGPRDDIERALHDLWRAELRIDTLDVFDDFFDIGGSSLAAMRILREVEDRYGCRFALTAMFDEASNIDGLAKAIRQATAAPST